MPGPHSENAWSHNHNAHVRTVHDATVALQRMVYNTGANVPQHDAAIAAPTTTGHAERGHGDARDRGAFFKKRVSFSQAVLRS